MILAPAAMAAESDPKKAAAKCFDGIGLDPDMYRIGHTKASYKPPIECCNVFTYVFYTPSVVHRRLLSLSESFEPLYNDRDMVLKSL